MNSLGEEARSLCVCRSAKFPCWKNYKWNYSNFQWNNKISIANTLIRNDDMVDGGVCISDLATLPHLFIKYWGQNNDYVKLRALGVGASCASFPRLLLSAFDYHDVFFQRWKMAKCLVEVNQLSGSFCVLLIKLLSCHLLSLEMQIVGRVTLRPRFEKCHDWNLK